MATRASSRRQALAWPVMTAALAVLVGACGTPGASSSASSSGSAASGPIKLAVIDAQSGQLSSLGKWEYKGAKLAVDQANAAGGINGRKVTLTVFDDQGDPTIGTNLARKVAAGGYVAVVGPAESAVALAIAPVLQAAKLPNMTSGQAPNLAKTNSPFIFLDTPTSTTFDTTLAQYAIQKGWKSIALITNNGAYGKGEHDAFLKELTRLGGKATSDQVVTPDQKDFSAALTTIRQTHPQALFIGAEEVESGLIAKQARDLGITATIIGAAPTSSPVFIQTAGAAAAEGAVTSTPYLGNDISAATKKFAAAYQATFGEVAEVHGAKAYDGAQILLAALKKTNGAGGRALADAIRSTKYVGLLGTYNFDNTGVGLHQTQIGVIKNGVVVPAS